MNELTLMPTSQGIDPTLFAVNWDVLFEVLVMIVILSFLLERSLSLLFESRWFTTIEGKREAEKNKGTFKPLIAAGIGAAACILWGFDAFSIVLMHERATVFGAVLTGAVVAGGSKASLKLFHDVMDVRSKSYKEAKGILNEQ